jgi:hypothetical protein
VKNLSDGQKIKRIIAPVFTFLEQNGFHRLERGRVARAFEHFAHVIEISRSGQTRFIEMRFGIAVFNTNCQHLHQIFDDKGALHSAFNASGKTFTAVGRGSALLCDSATLIHYLKTTALPILDRFKDAESLFTGDVDSDAFERQLSQSIKGAGNVAYIKKNSLYWHGNMDLWNKDRSGAGLGAGHY